jgi:hypothetical protein
MRLRRLPRALEDQGLRGIKGSEISGAPCVFAKFNCEYRASVARGIGVPWQGIDRPWAS